MRFLVHLSLALIALPALADSDGPSLSDGVAHCDAWNRASISEKQDRAREGTNSSLANLEAIFESLKAPGLAEYLEAMESCIVGYEFKIIEVWNEACLEEPYPTYAEVLESIMPIMSSCRRANQELLDSIS